MGPVVLQIANVPPVVGGDCLQLMFDAMKIKVFELKPGQEAGFFSVLVASRYVGEYIMERGLGPFELRGMEDVAPELPECPSVATPATPATPAPSIPVSDDEAPPAPKKRPQPPPAMPAKAKVKGKKGADEAEAEVEEIKRPPFELFEQEDGGSSLGSRPTTGDMKLTGKTVELLTFGSVYFTVEAVKSMHGSDTVCFDVRGYDMDTRGPRPVSLRHQDGRHKDFIYNVQLCDGFQRLAEHVHRVAFGCETASTRIALYCFRGRHRSVAAGEALCLHLKSAGAKVKVRHLTVDFSR